MLNYSNLSPGTKQSYYREIGKVFAESSNIEPGKPEFDQLVADIWDATMRFFEDTPVGQTLLHALAIAARKKFISTPTDPHYPYVKICPRFEVVNPWTIKSIEVERCIQGLPDPIGSSHYDPGAFNQLVRESHRYFKQYLHIARLGAYGENGGGPGMTKQNL